MGIPSYFHLWNFATYRELAYLLPRRQIDCLGGFHSSVVSEYLWGKYGDRHIF
ncbi:hypothetical protein FEV09_16650 [Pseudanabaena catenata USMAC16]|uniref:Uncharacterized protein n=1 Tax=Pseudanabaena catenata USMAC16 TaxID=1855837 RepID=A0A9X4M9B7_9CYAN|nr:hypothetical protein [Pseudanabaena catenata]MDG3496178.1 hypothetical protein [Pseudanabaena catenata USMAC16]